MKTLWGGENPPLTTFVSSLCLIMSSKYGTPKYWGSVSSRVHICATDEVYLFRRSIFFRGRARACAIKWMKKKFVCCRRSIFVRPEGTGTNRNGSPVTNKLACTGTTGTISLILAVLATPGKNGVGDGMTSRAFHSMCCAA